MTARGDLAADERSTIELFEKSRDSVVYISTAQLVRDAWTRNVFSVFGGVPEITVVREGKLRCQGAFAHPILAGTYAATCFPLFVALWFQSGRNKLRAAVGACCAAVATVAASSSGALLALISVCIGFGLWPLRFQMRWIRRGIVFLVIVLALVMKAPVWYSIAKISEITGGTGWWRSYMIDQAINHFNEWWLFGSTYTAHWGPAGIVLAADPKNTDITNNYIAEGLGGGLLKLGLFVAMIVLCYKTIGRRMRRAKTSPFAQRILIWAIGICLTAHCVSFISVAYFDQIVVMWYWLLAIVSMLAARKLRAHHFPSGRTASPTGNETLTPVQVMP